MNLIIIRSKTVIRYLKRQIKSNMSKTTISVIIYILGLIFGALVLDLWSAETSPKALLGMIWTALFLIAIYFVEFKNQ